MRRLYIVYMQNERRTLLFVMAKSEDEVRTIIGEQTSDNYDICGILATADFRGEPSENIFLPDVEMTAAFRERIGQSPPNRDGDGEDSAEREERLRQTEKFSPLPDFNYDMY